MPDMLKPAAIKLRVLLYSLFNNDFPECGPPGDGRVSIDLVPDVADSYWLAAGYRRIGGPGVTAIRPLVDHPGGHLCRDCDRQAPVRWSGPEPVQSGNGGVCAAAGFLPGRDDPLDGAVCDVAG